jgi:hypothetical protein
MKLVIRAAMLGSVIVGGVHAGEMRDIHGRVACPSRVRTSVSSEQRTGRSRIGMASSTI